MSMKSLCAFNLCYADIQRGIFLLSQIEVLNVAVKYKIRCGRYIKI